MKIEKIIG